MTSANLNPADPITPSEQVYLNGERFAKKILAGNVDLLHSDAKVSMAQLGEAMIAVALLANEAVSSLRLEIREKKALLGLRTVDSLFVESSGSQTAWPSPSLEADLVSFCADASSRGEDLEVQTLIYNWMERDVAIPWKVVIERSNQALAQRGYLEATEETKLKIFKTVHYSVPASTIELLSEHPVEGIQALIEGCQRDLPAKWKHLTGQIQKAMRNRKESDDDFD